MDDAGVGVHVERALGLAGLQEAQHDVDLQAESRQARTDREVRLIRCDRILEPDVEHALLPVDLGARGRVAAPSSGWPAPLRSVSNDRSAGSETRIACDPRRPQAACRSRRARCNRVIQTLRGVAQRRVHVREIEETVRATVGMSMSRMDLRGTRSSRRKRRAFGMNKARRRDLVRDLVGGDAGGGDEQATATTVNRINTLLVVTTLDTVIGPKYTGARLRGWRRERRLAGSIAFGPASGRARRGEPRVKVQESQIICRRGVCRGAGCAGRRSGDARQGRGAGKAGSTLRSRSVLAEADAEQLGSGHDDRYRHLVRRSRLGHSSRQRPGSNLDRTELAQPTRERPEASASAACRRRRSGIRRGRQPRRQLGRSVAGRRVRLAGEQPRHRRRPQGLRVDRRQRRPDAHILKFTRDGKFVAQYGKKNARLRKAAAPRRRRKPNFVREQPRHEQLRPRRQDLHRSEGERRLRRGRLLQQARRRHRSRQRQDQALLGRLRRAADDAPLGPYDPTAPPPQQFRTPMHCAEMSNDGMVYICDRPNDRVQIFTSEGKFVKEVFVANDSRADGSVWDIAFSKDPQQTSSTWPTASTSTSACSTARRWKSSTTSATAAASRACSSACTASPSTRRATSTRRKPTPASACRSSSARAWARCRRAARFGLAGLGQLAAE